MVTVTVVMKIIDISEFSVVGNNNSGNDSTSCSIELWGCDFPILPFRNNET